MHGQGGDGIPDLIALDEDPRVLELVIVKAMVPVQVGADDDVDLVRVQPDLS